MRLCDFEPSNSMICGNYAVLVDLHVLSLGGQEDTSWFTTSHIEVQIRGDGPGSVLFLCLLSDLRVFPERYVVCVSRPEDASAHHRNPSLPLCEQSRSEYFSSVGETQEPLNSPTKTKKTNFPTPPVREDTQVSVYILYTHFFFFLRAKQASVQQDLCGSTMAEQQIDQRVCAENQKPELQVVKSESGSVSLSRSEQKVLSEANHKVPCSSALTVAGALIGTTQKQERHAENDLPDCINLNGTSAGFCQNEISQETSTKSQASPVSECKKTTLEVELLTPGKQAQRLSLTSNNTAQTNQNRLAASLRSLSVKPASSGSSIGSRSTLREEWSENVPRTSRLRRLKRS
uniref:SLX4 interacting protein n=1 Tax=Pundamilia nyererei TaxID=303518 RepID=A0A3B4G928_9CICH